MQFFGVDGVLISVKWKVSKTIFRYTEDRPAIQSGYIKPQIPMNYYLSSDPHEDFNLWWTDLTTGFGPAIEHLCNGRNTMETVLVRIVIGLAFCTTTTAVAEQTHFGYSGEAGPENWSKLSPDFRACADGKNQSPIDLKGFVEAQLPPLQFKYSTLGLDIVNNGHAVQVNYANGSQLLPGDDTFELKQFHFHSPSEHTLNGKAFPIEMHLVHADQDGDLAVVSVLMAEGPKENPTLAKLWAQMPGKAGDKNKLGAKVNASDLLPKSKDYYRYSGSLTTPPCSEGVRWYVLKQPITVSKAQIEQFTKVLEHPNNRPVQPVNARAVLK